MGRAGSLFPLALARLVSLSPAVVLGLMKYGTVAVIAGIAALVLAVPLAWLGEGQPSADENPGGCFALFFMLFVIFVIVGTLIYFLAGGFGPHEPS
jgi:hypothetical protein